MKTAFFLISGLVLLAGLGYAILPKQSTPKADDMKGLAGFTMKDINGKDQPLKQYVGKTVLIVNTASKCGLTPQYEGLEALYDKYKDQGFVVLGFPCNQFMGQEPGTEKEILEFCTTKFDVSFPMFSKVNVKGPDAHPLYQWLVHATPDSKDVEWNFGKFLIAKDGKTVTRFGSRTTPGDDAIVAAIEKSLAE